MSARPAGIKAVAARAGVSVGTVSNVLNRPDQVSPGTRERVEQAMADLSFVRNSSAGALKAGHSRSLGLLVLDLTNPFFTSVARGVEEVAAAAGYAVLLCNADASRSRQETHLRFLEEQRVDGVLLTPVDDDRTTVDLLRSRGTSVVLVDEPGQEDCCSVAVDDHHGGLLAGQHLVASGRRRIAYVTGPSTVRQAVERGAGLKAATRRAKATVQKVALTQLTGAEGYAATSRVLQGRPDAVLCANDVVALGLLRGLLEKGVRVPEDISLVGYDDIEFAATAAVPLTSVRQPAVELGRSAATLLLEEIIEPSAHVHEQVLFRPELVIRQSSN